MNKSIKAASAAATVATLSALWFFNNVPDKNSVIPEIKNPNLISQEYTQHEYVYPQSDEGFHHKNGVNHSWQS